MEYVKKPKFCINCGFSLTSGAKAARSEKEETEQIQEKKEISANYDQISSLNVEIDVQCKKETVGSILEQSTDTPPIDIGRDHSPEDLQQTLSDFKKEAGTLRPKK